MLSVRLLSSPCVGNGSVSDRFSETRGEHSLVDCMAFHCSFVCRLAVTSDLGKC